MKKIKENKGITLIALIITIIVLIILAVVAINAVRGDGIIAHAKNARDDYQTAQKEENSLLSKYQKEIEDNNPNLKDDKVEWAYYENEYTYTPSSSDSDQEEKIRYIKLLFYIGDNSKIILTKEALSNIKAYKVSNVDEEDPNDSQIIINTSEELSLNMTQIWEGIEEEDGYEIVTYNKNIDGYIDDYILKDINGNIIKPGLTMIKECTVDKFGNSCYSMPQTIEKVTFLDGVTQIRKDEFWDCIYLTSVTLPNTLEEIGYSAFQRCTNLKYIKIPSSVVKVYSNAFGEWTSSQTIDITGCNTSEWDTNWAGYNNEVRSNIVGN